MNVGNDLAPVAASEYIRHYPSGHRADRLTAQIKRPKSHGLLNQFQNAGREAKGKKWDR